MRFFSFIVFFVNNLQVTKLIFFKSKLIFFDIHLIALSNQTRFYLFMSLKHNYCSLFMNYIFLLCIISVFLPISSLIPKAVGKKAKKISRIFSVIYVSWLTKGISFIVIIKRSGVYMVLFFLITFKIWKMQLCTTFSS